MDVDEITFRSSDDEESSVRKQPSTHRSEVVDVASSQSSVFLPRECKTILKEEKKEMFDFILDTDVKQLASWVIPKAESMSDPKV